MIGPILPPQEMARRLERASLFYDDAYRAASAEALRCRAERNRVLAELADLYGQPHSPQEPA